MLEQGLQQIGTLMNWAFESAGGPDWHHKLVLGGAAAIVAISAAMVATLLYATMRDGERR